MKKQSRTISGVTPVAVMTEPAGCPGSCIYCPTYGATPQSYTPESPAVLRARACNYDAAEQVNFRINILTGMGHPADKVELIIMGGTFLARPDEYQFAFIKGCFDALNGVESTTLEEAKHINETAARRCTGLCIETRPDWCGEHELENMLAFGTTRVELGVQTLSDAIYELVQRGHTVEDVARATALLRDYGLKVYHHWMPGLPGSTPEMDRALFRQLFSDERFRPDGLKMYPTMVVEGTILEQWMEEGRYTPYDDDVMINLVADMKQEVPKYVRIPRVLRDIPSKFIVGGLKDSLRDKVWPILKERGASCKCIRCREYGHRLRQGWEIGEPNLTRMDYRASAGREIFLSFEDDNETLFGLLRLRVPDTVVPALKAQYGNRLALVRELHVFGSELPLSERDPRAAQHRGLGKALMREAERIAREEYNLDRVLVLSGVGAREYYRTEFGYRLIGDYMVRDISE